MQGKYTGVIFAENYASCKKMKSVLTKRQRAFEEARKVIEGDLLLISVIPEILYRDDAFRKFIVPQHKSILCPGLISFLELLLEGSVAAVHHEPEPPDVSPELFCDLEGSAARILSHRAEIHIYGAAGLLLTYRLSDKHEALESDGAADCRGRLAAELLDEPVIPSAAADGALRAEEIGNPLDRKSVV